MSQYILTYNGGKRPESPEQGAKDMGRWRVWLDGLGEALVNPGTSLTNLRTVTSEGVSDEAGSNPLIGYSIIKADNMDVALDMARSCPFLEQGTIQVAEMMKMMP